MRVAAGSAAGRRLKVPRGEDVRPITDMIKQALFNTIGPWFNGESFLDLFAGSGAVGIEALSRGAGSAVFVEKNPAAASVIRDNLTLCGLEDRAQIVKADAMRAPSLFSGRTFDYIYIDPPFRKIEDYCMVIGILPPVAAPGGLIILRHPTRFHLPPECAHGLLQKNSARYGDSVLAYFEPADK